MQGLEKSSNRRVRAAYLAVVATALFAGAAAEAGSDSCREWRQEHCAWKAEAMRRYLTGAPQRELETAIFEMLQREAYLTSCEVSVQGSREVLVGWRLVGRGPEEYGSAVLESVLERAGFDTSLRSELSDATLLPPAPLTPAAQLARQGSEGAAR